MREERGWGNKGVMENVGVYPWRRKLQPEKATYVLGPMQEWYQGEREERRFESETCGRSVRDCVHPSVFLKREL